MGCFVPRSGSSPGSFQNCSPGRHEDSVVEGAPDLEPGVLGLILTFHSPVGGPAQVTKLSSKK